MQLHELEIIFSFLKSNWEKNQCCNFPHLNIFVEVPEQKFHTDNVNRNYW